MTLDDAQDKFVHTWGTLGSNWGISRTKAMIHALLLIAEEPLSTEDVMERLQISRGNANQNLRALVDWGLAYKEIIPGERKEFFVAEKEIWTMARQIIRERRKRELEPVRDILQDVSKVDDNSAQARKFRRYMHELQDFIELMSAVSSLALQMEKSSFMKSILKSFPVKED